MIPAILIVAFAGCGGGDSADTESFVERVTNVEYFTITPSTFENTITLPVIVLPYREVNLGVTNGGRVTEIMADKGDKVAKDSVLLETDDTILRATYESAKAAWEYQQKEFKRNQRLFADGSIAEAQLDAASLAHANARAQYEMAKKNYEEATLKAPFSGIVTMRNAEIGDMLSPGAPAFRIIDMSKVKIQAGIPEKHINGFKEGNKVSINIDALPGKTFEGRINYISPEASTGVRTFLAEMVVDNSDNILHAGVMGNASILLNVTEDAIMIPLNSLIETQHGRIVFVLNDDNTVSERKVELLNASDIMIQVTGLSAGEKIITKGQYDLIDGEQVNVTGEYSESGGEVI